MMTGPIRILHFEDNQADERLFQEYLKESPGDYRVEVAGRLSEGLGLLARNSVDVVLLDLGLPDSRGIESVKRVLREAPGVPIIVLSGLKDEGLAMRAVQEGAQDYLIKSDINARVLARSIDYAIERKRAEQRVIHLNRLLMSVREIGRLIVKEEEREGLLKAACDILRAVTGYGMVWIGLIEEGHTKVDFAAISGTSVKLLKEQMATWDDSPTGKGPAGTAIRTRKTCVCNDFKSPTFDPWREAIEKAGLRSCVAAPLIMGDKVFGALNVYSKHQDIFDDEEIGLIEEVGRDLAFALAAIESERERVRMEEALREQAEILDQIHDIVVTTDLEGTITSWNRGAERLIGYRAQEVLGKNIALIYPKEDFESIRERFALALRKLGLLEGELRLIRKDGSELFVHLTLTRKKDKDGKTTGIIGSAVDITERKRAEETLRESEEKHRTILHTIEDGYLEVDLKGNITSFNESMRRMLGYDQEEMMGLNYRRYMDEKSTEKVFKTFKEVFRTGIPAKTLDWRLIRKDGTIIDIETSISLKRNNSGTPIGFFGIGRDVTDRRRMEEAIESQNAFMQDLINAIPNPVLYKDAQGRYLGCNAAFERYLGRTRDEIVGRMASDFLPQELGYLYHEKDEELLANPGTQVYEAQIPNAEGIPRDLVFNKATFLDRAGAVGGLVGVIMDITERKKAEEEIRESEEKFRTFFETSRDVVYLSTIGGKFLDINWAAEELFGYSHEELLKIDVKNLYNDPDERERYKRTVAEDGFVKDHEASMLKKGGAIVDCVITASTRKDREGNIVGYQGIIRDITERKRMEQRLVQAEKLSSLGGILSGVAHELNNPLTSIIGNAQLLMRKEIGEEIRCKLEVIMKESVRSAKIIQGLLAFARKHKPERIPIDINDVITESYRLREYELKVNNVNARLDLSPDIHKTSADPYQLQQVFMNIINNANDALTAVGGGSLIIRSRFSGDSIFLEFVDDGPGIPEDIKKYIFDPFFTTKEVGKGTGLGLSIAYGIVSEHGGKIDVESSPGKGTAFIVELPLAALDIDRGESVVEPIHKPNGRKTLLVVEDETSLRNLIMEALSSEGYHVDASGSGEEAIESIERNEYSAIISDLKMPGLGGKELYTFVQKYYPGLSNKMVFITGDVLGRDTQNFLRITGNRYLEKPFEIKTLLNVLADVLGD